MNSKAEMMKATRKKYADAGLKKVAVHIPPDNQERLEKYVVQTLKGAVRVSDIKESK